MEDDHAENGETVDHSQVVGQLCLSRTQFTRGEILEELKHPSASASLRSTAGWRVGGGRVSQSSQPSNYLRLSSQFSQSTTLHYWVMFGLYSALLSCSATTILISQILHTIHNIAHRRDGGMEGGTTENKYFSRKSTPSNFHFTSFLARHNRILHETDTYHITTYL